MKIAVLHQGDRCLATTNALIRNAVNTEQELVTALRHKGVDCVSVLLDDGMRFVQTLKQEEPDLVLNDCDLGLRYDPKLEPHVTALLDTLALSYTGSDYFTLAMTNDKFLSKQLLSSGGVTCPAAVAVRPGQPVPSLDFPLPVICKPLANHNSNGIDFSSVLYQPWEVERKVRELQSGSSDYLLEQYIDGREIIAGFLGNGEDLLVLPLEEIAFGEYFRDKPKILTYDSKWADTAPANVESTVVIPAPLSQEQQSQIKATLIKIATIFGIRDYGRVDFRLDQAGRLYAIDVNANPDIGKGAGLSKMALAHGISYDDMIDRIVVSAQRRARGALC